jgi:DNA-binding NarL/FixJ family response regulator
VDTIVLTARSAPATARAKRGLADVVVLEVPPAALTAVLICDDPLWEHSISWLVTSAGVEIVGRGHDVRRALELASRFQPSLVLIETSGDVDPADLYRRLKQIHKLQPSIRTIVLCAPEQTSLRDAALAGGAMRVVSRENASELLEMIELTRTLDEDRSSERPLLTRRELEILRLVASGRTNRQVAELIWVTDQTVKYHLANVYRKLGVNSRAEAVEWAVRSGLTDSTPVLAGR